MRPTIIAFLLLFNLITYAQDFTTSDNTLIALSTSIQEDWIDKLDSFKPSSKRVKEEVKENIAMLERLFDEGTLKSVYQELAEQKKIVLKDKDILKDYITYSQTGLPTPLIPKTVIKKLNEKGYSSDFYFDINILPSLSMGNLMKGLPGQVKPEMKCVIKIFDNNKELVKKAEAKYKPKKPIKKGDFPRRKFNKLTKESMTALAEKLQVIADEAIKAAVEQL